MSYNVEKKREYQREWVKKRRNEFFKDKKCSRCGSIENLELDHINPKTKITHKIFSLSQNRRNEELKKCQVLCCKCHFEKSNSEMRRMIHGKYNMYRKYKCRCILCVIAAKELHLKQYKNRIEKLR